MFFDIQLNVSDEVIIKNFLENEEVVGIDFLTKEELKNFLKKAGGYKSILANLM